MANREHLAKLKEGVEAFNQWRKRNPKTKPNLSEADLSEANLFAAQLSEAILGKANFSRADLRHAMFMWADLSGVNFSKIDLSEADLRKAILISANLSKANLYNANLWSADLSHANLRRANLSEANLNETVLREADLTGANLSLATLVGTNLEGADLTSCLVHGISVWDVNLKGATQSNLVITPHGESTIQVDNLEVAQFIYLLVNNAKIRDVIDTVGKKAVLILGRFTEERKSVLEAIRKALRQSGYLPILFDFETPSNRDTEETIVTLAGLVRFIIADITDPKSVPQELTSILKTLLSVPVQPLLQIGHKPWGMFDHIKRHQQVLPIHPYKNQKTLLTELEPKVILPAEAKVEELKRK